MQLLLLHAVPADIISPYGRARGEAVSQHLLHLLLLHACCVLPSP
jgi:hypothetical protein